WSRRLPTTVACLFFERASELARGEAPLDGRGRNASARHARAPVLERDGERDLRPLLEGLGWRAALRDREQHPAQRLIPVGGAQVVDEEERLGIGTTDRDLV